MWIRWYRGRRFVGKGVVREWRDGLGGICSSLLMIRFLALGNRISEEIDSS